MSYELYGLNDYELLYMMRTGDAMAHQMMLRKYENYMKVLMERFVDESMTGGREDLNQECRILLWELCMAYREDLNCRFLTFLVNGVRNRMNTIRRIEKRKTRNIKLISLDACVREGEANDCLGDFIDPRISFYQPEYEWRYADSVKKLKELIMTLDEKEKLVWKLMNEKTSYEDAARIMGITRKQFDNQRLRLKKKIVYLIMKSEKNME